MSRNLSCACALFTASLSTMASKPPTTSDDISAIVALLNGGHSNQEISNITGVKLRTVQRWVKRYRDGGEVLTPTHRKRVGMTRKTSARTLNIIKRQTDCNPRVTAKELKEQNPALLGEVSLRTVQRRLHEDLHYRSCRPRLKPHLTEKQIKNRVLFCKNYKDWSLEKWRHVLWSDEAVFSVTGNRSGRVYRPPRSDPYDPRYTQGVTKHPDTIMVWGSFSYFGVGEIVVLPRNMYMNKDNYLELLVDHLPESFEKCQANFFMQDGAPCHRAKDVTGWPRDCEVDFFSDWPANSPDLNPIENLWALMKKKLRRCDTSTIPRLEEAVRNIWLEMEPNCLQSLADSVPRCLQECLRRRGHPTKY